MRDKIVAWSLALGLLGVGALSGIQIGYQWGGRDARVIADQEQDGLFTAAEKIGYETGFKDGSLSEINKWIKQQQAGLAVCDTEVQNKQEVEANYWRNLAKERVFPKTEHVR